MGFKLKKLVRKVGRLITKPERDLGIKLPGANKINTALGFGRNRAQAQPGMSPDMLDVANKAEALRVAGQSILRRRQSMRASQTNRVGLLNPGV